VTAPRRVALAAGVLGVLGVVALAGCGVQEDAAPRRIDPKTVPFALLSPTLGTTSTTLAAGPESSPVTIYLVDDQGRLVDAIRQVRGAATVAKAVDALLGGATQTEADLRLSSAITAGTKVLDVDYTADGTVVVDLSRDLLKVTGRRQIQAFAQLVFTVTAIPDVERVDFRFDGKAGDVPRGDGQLTGAPLTRRDFRTLASN
jgi:spore germination protein GerM